MSVAEAMFESRSDEHRDSQRATRHLVSTHSASGSFRGRLWLVCLQESHDVGAGVL
jgi:hypothetical protein